MKSKAMFILAGFICLFFETGAQVDGIKTTVNPSSKFKQTDSPTARQDLAMLQDHNTTGGGAGAASFGGQSGGIYLEPGWAPGSVTLRNNKVIDNIMLRYDIYHQQLQFIQDEDTLAFARPEEAEFFLIGGKKFIYAEYLNGAVIGKSYFEVLSEGRCELLIRRVIRYHMNEESKSGQQDEAFIRECEFYLVKPGERAKPVATGRKSILCAFSDKEAEVKNFMEEKNLKMKDCNQMKLVVDFYNSLQ
ncbi:MAG TPA: hypothetical protein PLW31_11295 [Bacteroidales bacterium]|nr:hypothetical protein [Bacteroidales bacterium]HOX78610.1 hypothetical protein [Bacteroidales bacterium]HPI86621.1 hypothetical protein [Bacteroidales bacterium]HPM92248.1 hypothetical protein [Bacteroidales bacterium]